MTSLTNESNFIPYSFYYEKLVNNIGTNTVTTFNGSCSYVALEMVLSYYDTVIRDDVIIEARDVTMFRRFSSTERLDASLYPRSPGIDDVFHSNMINLGIDMGFTKQNDFSANSSKLKELLEIYLQGRHLEYTLHSIDLFTSKLNFCKEGINSKNPVVIGIDGIDTSIDSRKLNHAVVAYGYDDSGIFVHFGWKDEDLTKVNINKYNIHSAYYVELNEEHICSDNYVWEKNGCSGTLCPCGSIICNHITRTILKYDYFYHKNQCVGCGCFSLQEHNYYESNEYKICSDCGYKIEKNHSHVYLYKSSRDGRTHNAICRCGYSKTEVCMGYIAIGDVTASCTKCGQSII
ncbi:MAG: hypothetical protein K2K50_03060 [Anaeroplasmataceae bacterium]|nr:hypothetical protein [Anaeroplasmataceae bacterium]